MKKRVIWFVLDSVGIGGAPDAEDFGDAGADTLGHIAEWFMREMGRPLALPTLTSLGLLESYRLVHGCLPEGMSGEAKRGFFAAGTEVSTGKDTPSGHWEMAGVAATWDWGYFPRQTECFPQEVLQQIYDGSTVSNSLGHCHASGTEVIARLGEESLRTGSPIFYTSADSVFQIAAHEEQFGLENLYALCEVAREVLDPLNVGRVIARPFLGTCAENFERTGNRKDYAVTPPSPTVLQVTKEAGHEVVGVGKIGDIFAHTGLTKESKASGHEALWETTKAEIFILREAEQSGIVMTNFVDFDMLYGHRRDPEGYGLALEEWDERLAGFLPNLEEGELLIITADHGNDPTWKGTDHTRERVPILCYEKEMNTVIDGGIRDSFSNMAGTVSDWLELPEPSRNGLL